MAEDDPAPEWSVTVPADLVTAQPIEREATVPETLRAPIAARLGLQALDSLSVQARLYRDAEDVIVVEGTLQAEVVQTCVVTLQAVRNRVTDSFAARFAEGGVLDVPLDVALDPETPDPPEPLTEGGVDLGELTVQFLSLALDPYPRRQDAELPEAAGDAPPSPFAGLEDLLRRSRNG